MGIFDKFFKGSIQKKLVYECQNQDLVCVDSAFSGFVMIRTETLEKCTWKIIVNKVCSEHNGFCRDVLQYGNIVCAKYIKVYWTQ